MSNSIHGHEVMHMMLESGQSYTRASLRQAIHERFGKEARFYTCSASDLDADALISFLEARGKFVDMGTGFGTAADRLCSHESEHKH